LFPPVQAYHLWLHNKHRLNGETMLTEAVTPNEDFVTIGYVEMDGGEIPKSAVRYALLPSRFNPRRNLMVAVTLHSNNGAEARFSLVGSPSPPPRDVSPPMGGVIVSSSVVGPGVAPQGCINHRHFSRGCMRYQPPCSAFSSKPAILPRSMYESNACTAWVFYTPPEASTLSAEFAAAALEPLDEWVPECAAYADEIECPAHVEISAGVECPAELKNPGAERGSNDTVISFLA
jgi:hypothetical protein